MVADAYKNKNPSQYGNGKIYHPFTYPPICAQDHGRAPAFITCTKMLSQMQLRSDVHTGDL